MPRQVNEQTRALIDRPREEWVRLVNKIPDMRMRRRVALHVWWDYLSDAEGRANDDIAKYKAEYSPADLSTDRDKFIAELVKLGYTEQKAIERATPPKTSTIYKTQHEGGAYKRRACITQPPHRAVSR